MEAEVDDLTFDGLTTGDSVRDRLFRITTESRAIATGAMLNAVRDAVMPVLEEHAIAGKFGVTLYGSFISATMTDIEGGKYGKKIELNSDTMLDTFVNVLRSLGLDATAIGDQVEVSWAYPSRPDPTPVPRDGSGRR